MPKMNPEALHSWHRGRMKGWKQGGVCHQRTLATVAALGTLSKSRAALQFRLQTLRRRRLSTGLSFHPHER